MNKKIIILISILLCFVVIVYVYYTLPPKIIVESSSEMLKRSECYHAPTLGAMENFNKILFFENFPIHNQFVKKQKNIFDIRNSISISNELFNFRNLSKQTIVKLYQDSINILTITDTTGRLNSESIRNYHLIIKSVKDNFKDGNDSLANRLWWEWHPEQKKVIQFCNCWKPYLEERKTEFVELEKIYNNCYILLHKQ